MSAGWDQLCLLEKEISLSLEKEKAYFDN
jgi:hypothetical protein